MDAAIVVALIALVGTVGNVVATYVVNVRSEKRREAARSDATWKRYRGSLGFAAEELSNRIGNILHGDFLDAYAEGPHADEAVQSTLFRFAQYFGWSEIVRRYMRYPDPRHAREAERVAGVRLQVAETFSTDKYAAEGFMMWWETQRAVGELMISRDDDVVDTMGVSGFVAEIDDFRPWLTRMEQRIRTKPSRWDAGDRERLEDVGTALDALAREARQD